MDAKSILPARSALPLVLSPRHALPLALADLELLEHAVALTMAPTASNASPTPLKIATSAIIQALSPLAPIAAPSLSSAQTPELSSPMAQTAQAHALMLPPPTIAIPHLKFFPFTTPLALALTLPLPLTALAPLPLPQTALLPPPIAPMLSTLTDALSFATHALPL